jgi:uncharacterized repeat protein (TIGR03803 family)
MREHRYRSAALAALALTTVGADYRQTPNPGDPGIPTAHACVLRDFGEPNGPRSRVTDEPIWFREPGAIAEGPDQAMYSTSPSGGHRGLGAAFKIFPDGKLTVLFPFDGTHGSAPQGGLTNGHDGWFYGTASGGGTIGTGVLFRIGPNGGTPQVLYNFRNGSTRGLVPPCQRPKRCAWTGKQRADAAGAYPLTPPMLGPGGTFYGVTWYSNNQQFGTLYAIAPPYDSTTFRTLCIFDPRMARDTVMARYVCDPKITTPNSLIVGTGGALYGTATGGQGWVFSATASGKVTPLHQFDLTHGARPTNVMQASDGVLYGTTMSGGDLGGGVIWQLNPGGGGFRVMSSFRAGTFLAGVVPVGALVEGQDARGHPDGYLYGTTKFGGRGGGRGIVYKIRRGGDSLDLHVLHDFSLYATGRSAGTPPFLHSDGNLYGFTFQGGLRDAGVFYRISEQDLPELKTREASFGKVDRTSKDQLAVPTDSLIVIHTHIAAYQNDTLGKPSRTNFNDGIGIKVSCRNPHFVQFISRENIRPDGTRESGQYAPSSGTYALTTDPNNPVWHSDGAGKPDAYFDHGRGAPRATYTSGAITQLLIFDQPNFGGPYFPPSQQSPDSTSHRWRANFRTFALCNCGLVREVRWTVEEYQGKVSYTGIKIWLADNSALPWINSQLVGDGFRKLP